MNPLLHERRLLSLTRAQELKANAAARAAARGATPVVAPTPTATVLGQAAPDQLSTRGYQAQADFQNQQSTLNRNTTLQNTTLQSYIDPNTGRDSRQFDAQGQPIAGTGTLAGVNASLLQPMGSTDGTATNQYAQPTAPSAPTTAVNPLSGQTYSGAAAERLNARMAKQDPLEAERARIEAMPTTMDEPVFDGNGNLVGSNKVPNPQAIAEKEAKLAALDAKEAAAAQKKQQDQAKANQNAMNTAKAQATTDIAMAQLMAGAPPEALPVLQAVQAAMNAMGAIPEDMTREEFEAQEGGAISKPFDAIQKILDESNAFTKSLNQQVNDLMKEGYDKNQKLLAEQQANINEQLTWQEQKLSREMQDQNHQALRRMSISLALRGGFGSVGGNQEIEQARQKGEQAVTDLQKEFGFKRTDVSLQFTEMTNDAYMNYHSNFLKNVEVMQNKLSDLDMQGISNQAAKGNAVTSAYNTFQEGIKADRKELAGMLTKAAEFVYGVQQDARAEQLELLKMNAKDPMSMKDMLGFSSGLRKEIGGNQTIKDFKLIDSQFSIMNTALDDWKTGKQQTATAVDQALITIYNKMLDPSSVVRESEYARTPSDLGLMERIRGQGEKFFTGGAGLTNEIREDLVAMASRYRELYESKFQEEIQPFILDIDDWNSAYPESPIRYEQVISNIDRVYLPSQTFDTWSQQAGGAAPEGNVWTSMVGTGQIVGGSPYHKGADAYAVDIDGRIGDPIPAPTGGTVISVDSDGQGGYGKNVIVRDALGYEHLFAHLDDVNVEEGQAISPNYSIGKMGNTGNVIAQDGGDGSHLHYRITKDGSAISMTEYQRFADARQQGYQTYAMADDEEDVIYVKPTVRVQKDESLMSTKAPPDPYSIPSVASSFGKGALKLGGAFVGTIRDNSRTRFSSPS